MQLKTKKLLSWLLVVSLFVGVVSFATNDGATLLSPRHKEKCLPRRKNIVNSSQQVLQPEKQETVFVNLNPDGTSRQIIDSNWLKNSAGSERLIDATSLLNIEPISNAQYSKDEAGRLVWQTTDQDVYYQGDTDKALPIDVGIKYQLDDQPIEPAALAGKSGHVKITISFSNNLKKPYQIGDKIESVATPFTAVALVGLPNDTFSNITLQNGSIFSDGNNQIATFVGFPSLGDSLQLADPTIKNMATIELPEKFVIEADVSDFNLATIAIALTPELPDAVKDIDNNVDIDDDLADIEQLLAAKAVIERIDPTDRIKGLVRDSAQTDRAQLLLNDLFKFYDLETSLIEELPAYLNDENIQLFDRVKQDLDQYQVALLLDNEVIRDLPNKMTAQNIEQAKKMLARYDEIGEFDIDRLDSMNGLIDNREELRALFAEAEDLFETVDEHAAEVATLKTLSAYSDQFSQLVNRLESSNIASQLSQSDVDYMLQALAQKKMAEATQQFMSQLPASGNLTAPEQQLLSGMVDRAIAAGQLSTTSGGAIKAVIGTGVLPPTLRTEFVNLATLNIQSQVSSQLATTTQSALQLIAEAQGLKQTVQLKLGDDYKADIAAAANFARDLQSQIDDLEARKEESYNQIQAARTAMYNEEDIAYFLEWKDKLRDIRQEFDENAENIEIMRDLIAQYDDPKIKNLYDNLNIIIDDIEALRPIAKSFKALLDKPVYDRQWHNLPTTLNSLLNMKHHLENSRYLANTLQLSLNDEVISALNSVLQIVDKADGAHRLEDIADDLEQLKLLDDRKSALIDLSENYTSFAGKSADMASQVRFVMKTDPIEVEQVEAVYRSPEPKKPSFFEWVSSLFNF